MNFSICKLVWNPIKNVFLVYYVLFMSDASLPDSPPAMFRLPVATLQLEEPFQEILINHPSTTFVVAAHYTIRDDNGTITNEVELYSDPYTYDIPTPTPAPNKTNDAIKINPVPSPTASPTPKPKLRVPTTPTPSKRSSPAKSRRS